MLFMNEDDIDDALRRFDADETPNLAHAAHALWRFMGWTNANSDGWPYWRKAARAAVKLMTLIQSADRFDPEDVTPAQVRAALVPIKSFLTRQGVDPSVAAAVTK